MTGPLRPLPSRSQRLQSGRPSALSPARAPQCAATPSSDKKSGKTDVRAQPSRGGCPPEDQYYWSGGRTLGHGACSFHTSRLVDLAAIRQNRTTKPAPHPPGISSFHGSVLPFLRV